MKHVLPSNRCHYCRCKVYPAHSMEVRHNPGCQSTKDHIIPRSLGVVPDEDRHRVVIACRDCNDIKADAPADQFVFWLRQEIRGGKTQRTKHFREFRALLSIAGFEAAKREVLRARRAPAPEMPPPQSISDIVRRLKA